MRFFISHSLTTVGSSADIIGLTNSLIQDENLLESFAQISDDVLQEVNNAGDFKANKQKLYLAAKKAQIDTRAEQVAIVKEERVYLKPVVNQKKNLIAELQGDVTAEASHSEMHKRTLTVSWFFC